MRHQLSVFGDDRQYIGFFAAGTEPGAVDTAGIARGTAAAGGGAFLRGAEVCGQAERMGCKDLTGAGAMDAKAEHAPPKRRYDRSSGGGLCGGGKRCGLICRPSACGVSGKRCRHMGSRMQTARRD